MIRKWLVAPGGYTDTYAGWGSGAENERGAANRPLPDFGLNGQTSRQEYQQGDPVVVILKLGPYSAQINTKMPSKRNEL